MPRPPRDRGEHHAIGPRLSEALRHQHEAHPRWSYQLHLDNLAVLVAEQPELGPLPSYASLRRYMVAHGWPRASGSPLIGSSPIATAELAAREVRSYEATHVAGLWHLDFHHGSRKILSPQGEWFRPLLLAILDDHSRCVCHTQWYHDETAKSLALAFTAAVSRTQRRSDGTLTLDGVRFEVPTRFRHLRRLALRYKSWDLRQAWLIDEAQGVALEGLYPLDRARNAESVRRPLPAPAAAPPAAGMSPLLSCG